MEERELLWIGIIGKEVVDMYTLRIKEVSREEIFSTYSALISLAYSATEKYVDTLTDKQREALIFIRMLPEYRYVEGVGAWVNAVDPAGKVYIIDC